MKQYIRKIKIKKSVSAGRLLQRVSKAKKITKYMIATPDTFPVFINKHKPEIIAALLN